ncbi:Asp23/Gls24 family envelope stress response protein [Nonomuraea guangzhouensis]|uniref:Asp23/Gls24 family envelope stress response protein n=1 Tax=Nonomuraea guangzhouensis TaxID=1291555 RepID=A0ABW4G0Z9_9ACTN|nr:Asp23/Gls24 family envelope stress response protein [Nonomuraea guangzhouensis]
MTTDLPASETAVVVVPEQRPAPVPPERRGRTEVADRVAGKIAGHAAREVAGVREVSERGGLRRTRPASATVRGGDVEIGLTVSVAYPVPLRAVAGQIRNHVAARVAALTGLRVSRVDVTMTEFTMTDFTSPPTATWEEPRETPGQAPQGSSWEATREAPQEGPRETAGRAPQGSSWEATREVSREATREAPQEAPRQTSPEAPQEGPRGVSS